MSLERCPTCGGRNIWRSSSWYVHILRAVLNSSRRYCNVCKDRWIDQNRAPFTPWRKAILASVCFSAFILVFVGVYTVLKRRSLLSKAGLKALAVAASSSITGGGAGGAGASEGVAGAAGSKSAPDEAASAAAAAALALGAGEKKGGFGSLLKDLGTLSFGNITDLLKAGDVSKGPSSAEVEGMDKKVLWEKYGHMFGSKEDAKKTYTDYLEKKKQQEAGGGAAEEPPPEEYRPEGN